MQSGSAVLCVSKNTESSQDLGQAETTEDGTMSPNKSVLDTSDLFSESCTNSIVDEVHCDQDDGLNVLDSGGTSPVKHAFEVNVNAIQSVPIEEQADEIKDLGLKVFDHQTLEKGIWDQVEQETQRLQTVEELAILDTTIKKTELLLKRSKQTSKPKPEAVVKAQETKINELASLQAKKSLLRDRLTQGKKADSNEGESERERSIRLGEMTPFGTILGKKSSELSTLSKYMQHQQEQQMKMEEKRSVKRKALEKSSAPVAQKQRHPAEHKKSINNSEPADTCLPHTKDKLVRYRKKRNKETLGSSIEFVDGEEYLTPAPSPGEVETVDFEDSGSEYKPSEESSLDDFEEDVDGMSIGDGKSEGAEQKNTEKLKRPKATSGKVTKDKKAGGTKKNKTFLKTRKKQPKAYQDPEDWATDDSDWLCTDDELSSGSEEPGKRMKRLVRKEVDDGNEEDYYRRLKHWEKSSPGLREQIEEDCHELDNGYKVPSLLWNKLYKYQRVGVQWLWELHQQACGGILGDEMGLGKTIQIISFLAGLRASQLKTGLQGYRGLGPTLIVCPTTVMHQWVREFHTWCPPIRVAVLHESGAFQGKRHHLIRNMVKAKGVVITSYTAVVRLKDHLLDANWHYIILDEGHKIRNPDAQVTVVVKQFRTPHRVILSGSPVQNHLRELWSLMDFVFPGKLGTLPVFMAQFGVPIVQGGYANASEVMVATAFKCATVLKDTISPYLMRRMKTDVNSHISLPPKNEQVLFCRLTDAQRDLYKGYLDCGEVGRILDGRLQIFVGLINLRKICNHPHLYSGGPKLFAGESEDRIPVEERYGHWTKAGKMIVMEALLKMWRRQEHRVLIFTQSKQMLGIMESFILQRGYKYLKLDGGTSISARQPLINKYNQDKSYFVMLLTTKVGGLGVNLTGADRVVIYDPDWNPATDTQARERAWRIGQQNCVTVYRLITAGTIEEKMYHRQIFKQFLCNKVLKDPRQRRFFKSNDLLELFTLKEVDTEGSTETSAIFAGTGSQVHVKKKKTSPKKPEQRSPSVNKPDTARHSPHKSNDYKASYKKSEKASKPKNDDPSSSKSPEKSVTIQFSESKLQHMKQLAAMLSKKFANKSETDTGQVEMNESPVVTGAATKDVAPSNPCERTTEEGSKSESPGLPVCSVADTSVPLSTNSTCDRLESSVKNAGSEELPSAGPSGSEPKDKIENSLNPLSRNESCASLKENVSCRLDNSVSSISSEVENTQGTKASKRKSSSEGKDEYNKKHKKHKKHKKEKNARFEGERVPHLVKTKSMKNESKEDSVDEVAHNSKQDDYVLRKLFSKSGLQTAMRHDKIMEGGHSDYALIEGEARKVAQEAVKALKESRSQCWSATSGVPTWTGASGALRTAGSRPSTSKPKFGAKKKFGLKKTSTATSEYTKEEACGSGSLLAKMRARNMLLTPNEDTQPPDHNIISRSSSELLEDIRAFVAFGAETNEQATTQEIVSHFKDRLPSESSALFKQMLNQVCEFHRTSGGQGLWKLLPDFKW